MLEYEDHQIGPLEETERDGNKGETENILLKSAIDEFSHKHESKTTRSLFVCLSVCLCVRERGTHTFTRYVILFCSLSLVEKMREVHIVEENCDDEQVIEEDTVQLEGDQQWDCESILSTYSNLYNHPTLIKEPPRQKVNDTRNYLKLKLLFLW